MKCIFFQILFFTSIFAFAQNDLKINGTILNQKNSKISQQIDVYLFDDSDQLIKSAITQESHFKFNQLKSGRYHIQISSGETLQKEKEFLLEKNVDFNIIYALNTKEIQEVTIIKQQKKFKVENGNMTFEITDSPLNKLPTSSDLLSKLPFVMMDANGEGLSFLGKGSPLLYVENQRVDFSTLSAIAVDDIKSVEIIRNPSAKYESEGRAVIKINLKKSRKDGSQLTLSETATFQKRFSNNFSANYQQKKNKTEWKLNAAYNQINHWESNGFDYSVPTKNIVSDYIIKSITKRPQTIFGASLYQELNDAGDYLTLSVNSNFRPDKGDNNTDTFYSESGNSLKIKTLDQQDRKRLTFNSIFNYNKKISNWDANLFAGFQFKRESNKVAYNFYNNIDDSGFEFIQFRRQSYSGNNYSGRIDFEKKFQDRFLLESGGSYTTAETKTNNETDYQSLQPTQYFNYNFKESNFASYFNLGLTANKWNLKGGLRLETTSANGFNEIENQTEIKRNYIDWFPNAEITFQQNKDYIYTLNFRKSISRPNYADLSSGALYGSPYVEYAGNPDLVPSYTNTLSFSSNLKKWSVNASFYQTQNPVGYTLVYDGNTNISKFSAVNFEKEIGTNIGVDYPFQWKKWTSQNSLSVNYDKIEDSLAVIKKSTPYVYFSTNNTFDLSKNLVFLFDGSYISKRVEGLYENNGMCLVNLGFSSNISDFDFTISYNDIFNQMNYIQKMTYKDLISKGTFYGNTPTFSVALKYNFGKLKKSDYKENTVNENANRL